MTQRGGCGERDRPIRKLLFQGTGGGEDVALNWAKWGDRTEDTGWERQMREEGADKQSLCLAESLLLPAPQVDRLSRKSEGPGGLLNSSLLMTVPSAGCVSSSKWLYLWASAFSLTQGDKDPDVVGIHLRLNEISLRNDLRREQTLPSYNGYFVCNFPHVPLSWVEFRY